MWAELAMSDENQKKPVVDSKPTEELAPEELNKVNGGSILTDIIGQVVEVVGGTTVSPRDASKGHSDGKTNVVSPNFLNHAPRFRHGPILFAGHHIRSDSSSTKPELVSLPPTIPRNPCQSATSVRYGGAHPPFGPGTKSA